VGTVQEMREAGPALAVDGKVQEPHVGGPAAWTTSPRFLDELEASGPTPAAPFLTI
jgi:hypothetical protein